MTDELGRFGHHPNPAIDFCVEVDAIEGLAADVRAGLAPKGELADRIFRAMAFTVGGDLNAINAKDTLRRTEQAMLALTSQAQSERDQTAGE